MRRLLGGALEPRGLLLELLGRQRVGLVERDDFGFVREPVAIGFELPAHGLVGLARMLAGAVDEMQQDAAALDMAEEAVAEPRALVRALDQAGDVGEHEFAAVALDHAELRVERRERVIGDLGPGRAHRRAQGRLASGGGADDAGVRDQLEAWPTGALLARLAGVGMARRSVGRGLEMRIAEAAIAAAR